MPNETQMASRDRGSRKWLLAGIPALAAIAFIIYTAVSEGREAEAEESAPTTSESGK